MIRLYQSSDLERVLHIFRLNTPKYFHSAEEEDLKSYLLGESSNYYVFSTDQEIIAVGGINFGFENGSIARISWDIVHPNFQGKGIGSELLKYRIDQIKTQKGIEKIVVRTSQLAHSFYAKSGFKLDFITENFWAKGIDLYQMNLKLS